MEECYCVISFRRRNGAPKAQTQAAFRDEQSAYRLARALVRIDDGVVVARRATADQASEWCVLATVGDVPGCADPTAASH